MQAFFSYRKRGRARDSQAAFVRWYAEDVLPEMEEDRNATQQRLGKLQVRRCAVGGRLGCPIGEQG